MSSDSPKPTAPPAGWNDPPMFSYESRGHEGQAPRINLNKRISFPLNAGKSEVLGSTEATLIKSPPLTSSHKLPPLDTVPVEMKPNPSVVSASYPVKSSKDTDDILYKEIHENIESSIECISLTNERAAADIRRRIGSLETMWNDDKLDAQVKQRILQLSQAVRDKDIKRGQDIQRSLMVDHATVCSSWIPAVRHLLNQMESLQS